MAISHAFSNQVADGTNTSIVRPSDWNSAHNQYYTLSGNTLGASTVSGTNVVLQASGNVSLSGVGGTIVVYGTNPTVPTSYVSNVNGLSGAISLAVGSSLSSAAAGSTITFGLASNITTALQSAGNYLTTQTVQTQAVGNIAGTGFSSTTTAGVAIVGTNDSNGLSLGIPAYLTTQSVQTQASGNIARTGFTSTTTVGTAIVGTLNTAGLNLGVPAYLTTQSVQTQAAGNIAGTGFSSTTTAGTAITAALGTNGLTMAIPAYLTTAAGGGGIALGASTQTATSGTVNFVNSNGISFGMSGSNQITASHNGITSQSVQTQASGNIARTGFTSATTAGTAIVGTLNTAGLNLGVPAYLTTQSVQTQAAGNIAGTGFTSATTAGTAITAALGTNGLNMGIPAYLTAAAGGGAMYANLSGATSGNTTASGSTLNFSGINLTLSGTNNSQIAISAPATSGLTAGNNFSISSNGSTIGFSALAAAIGASNQTATSGTVNFANSNGITFGMSGSNQITASHNGLTTQTVQTQAAGNIAGTGFTTATTAGTAITGVLGTDGLNLGIPAYLTAAGGGGGAMYVNLSGATSGNTTASGSTLNFSGINLTLSGTNGSQIVLSAPATSSLAAGNNISISSNGSTINVLAQAVAVGAGTQAATSGTVNFGNANGITFGMSNSNQITASYTQLNQAFSATGGSSTFQTLNFANSNGITFSNTNASVRITHELQYTSNTSAITANAFPAADTTKFAGTNTSANNATITLNSNGLTISVAAPGGGGGGIALGAGTQTATSGTVNFVNSNGITFGMSGSSQITASHNGITTQTVQTQASGNIAGTGFTTATTAGTVITGALGTNGLNLGVPAYLTTQTVQTQASGAIAGTGFTTATTAGSVITGALGTNGLNLGIPAYLTAAGGGGAINVSAGTTSNDLQTIVFDNANGVSFGLNGSTVTASVATAGGVIESGYSPHGDYPLVVGQIGQGTLALDPDVFPDLTLNMVAIPINFSANNASTGSFTVSNWLGLYTRNDSSISLVHSTSFSTAITFSGIANSASYYGFRNLTYNWSTSVSGGRYWIGQIMRTTTGGASACSFSQYLASQINSNFGGAFGVATNATAQLTLGQGFYSASTTALPGSIAFTQIRGSNSLAQRFPMVAFGYDTV